MRRPHFPAARMIDIAREAGCSRAAVSHVLTGSGTGQIRVGHQKAAIIRRIARRLDYLPNAAARQLKGKRARILGFISRGWLDSFQLRVFFWVQQLATARGYQVLAAAGPTIEETEHTVRNFRSGGVEAALCCAPSWDTQDAEREAVLARLPRLVTLFSRAEAPDRVCVDCDEGDGIRQAVEHLAGRGRRRIALLLESDSASSRQRQNAFLDAHERLGRAVAPGQIYQGTSDWTWDRPGVDERVDAALQRLVVQDGCDAIITHDDYGAGFVIQGLLRRGLRCPQDMAVVGYQNDLVSHHLAPPLTTVHIPVREIVDLGVGMLIGAIENPHTAPLASQTLRPTLVVRGSS